MKCVNKCGDVVISAEFVLGNMDHIEINCFFCRDSFKSLESFSGHLKNIHKWLLEAISNYYIKPDEENSSESWPICLGKTNDDKNNITELSWKDAEKIETKPDIEAEPIAVVDVSNNNIKTVIKGNDITTDDEQSRDTDANWESSCSEEEPLSARKKIKKEYDEKEWGEVKRCRFTSNSVKEGVILELIAQLKNHPELWIVRCDEDKRSIWNNAMNEVYDQLKEKFPLEKFTELFVVRKLAFLKSRYDKAECGKIPASSVPYYEQLNFLKGQTRKGKDKEVIPINSLGRFLCTICNKDFANTKNVAKHMRSHRPEFRYKCEVCTRQFFFPNELRSHMLIHTNEKPFVCEVCGRGFRISSKLNRHLKIHRQQKDYKCELCPKSYSRRVYLNDHMNKHLNIKPAECETCGKRFYSKDLLRHHVKLHSDELGYKCTLCDKAFAQAAGRASHMRRNHKII